jgi:hypothetical protein
MDTNAPDSMSISSALSASQIPQLTPSGRLRQGYEYQDVQAIDLLIEWLEHNDRYQWVKLEDDDSGFFR